MEKLPNGENEKSDLESGHGLSVEPTRELVK